MSELLRSFNDAKRDPQEWEVPEQFDLSLKDHQARLEDAISDGRIASVIDPIEVIAEDVFEYEHTEIKDDTEAKRAFVEEIASQGESYGQWFLMPWSGELIRYADKETHRALRTSRNRNLLLPEEQNALYESTAAVFGLSVGSNAVEHLVRAGVVGKIIMADMDIISPSNLNRLPASQTEIGEKKLDVMAKKISIADPYLEQVHMPNGVSAENIDDLIHEHRPDFMVDAVDSLAIKAVIRAAGLRESVPVFMATDLDDKSILDIELYGKEEVVPFNGRLDDEAYRKLLEGAATQEEITGYTFALVGPENASERMLDSAFKAFGGELSGLPQLGTTAALGGIAVTRAARELILQNPDLTSGRSIVDTASFIAR